MPRILVVDDEVEVVNSLRRLLRRNSFEVETALSGREGLLKLLSFEPDVVLSDFRMPEMNGAEMLSKVKALRPLTLRLILSGYADLNSVITSVNEGEICRFFSKPWDDEALVASLKALLRERAVLAELHRPVAMVGPRYQVAVEQKKASVEVRVDCGSESLGATQAVKLMTSFMDLMGADLDGVGGLLERHQGKVSLVVEVGKGRRLTVELPMLTAPALAPNSQEAPNA